MKPRAMVLVVCLSVGAISMCGCASTLAEKVRKLEQARASKSKVEQALSDNKQDFEREERLYQLDLAKTKDECDFIEKEEQRTIGELKDQLDLAQNDYDNARAKSKDSRVANEAKYLADLGEKLDTARRAYLQEVAKAEKQVADAELKDNRECELQKKNRDDAEEKYHSGMAELNDKAEDEQEALDAIYKVIGDDLEKVEHSVRKWGKVNVSDFALLVNKGQFDLKYSMPAADYVGKARKGFSASESTSDISSLRMALGVQATMQPPAVPGGGGSEKGTKAPASSEGPTGGSSGEAQSAATFDQTTSAAAPYGGSTGGSSGEAQSTGISKKDASTSASPAGSTSGSGTQTQAGGKRTRASGSDNLAVSERTAMTTGLNDKLAELVMSQLANPSESTNGKVLFGVFQVTCQPGSENWKDYIADVCVTLEYAYDDGISNVKYSHKWGRQLWYKPAVLAVLPLMASQSMDLSASQSNQTQLALTLAAMFAAQPGTKAQADLLAEYARQQSLAMRSRTVVPTVTTYTDGFNFGFQIYPAFQAVEDPAAAFARGANVLQPICFPAVVVLRMEKTDFEETKWNYLVAHVHARWIPTRGRWLSNYKVWNFLLGWLENLVKADAPPDPGERLALAKRLDDASEIMSNLEDRDYEITRRYREVLRSFPSLDSASQGISRVTELPLGDFLGEESGSQQSDELIIQGVTSSAGQNTTSSIGQKDGKMEDLVGFVNAPTVISVVSSGKTPKTPFQLNEQPAVKMVTLDGCECGFTVVSKNALTVTVPAGSFDDRNVPASTKVSHRLIITTMTGTEATSLPANIQARGLTSCGCKATSLAKDVNIRFMRTIQEPVSNPSDFGYQPSITITRDPKTGKVIGISVNGCKNSAETEELLQAVEKILLTSEAPPAPSAAAASDKGSQQGNQATANPQSTPGGATPKPNPGVASEQGGSSVTVQRDNNGNVTGIIIDADATGGSKNLKAAEATLKEAIKEVPETKPAPGAGGKKCPAPAAKKTVTTTDTTTTTTTTTQTTGGAAAVTTKAR